MKTNNILYEDDCISGEASIDAAMKLADQMEFVLRKRGFALKGFSFSNHDPLDHLSCDGNSVSVRGLIWHPKYDKISIDVSVRQLLQETEGKEVKKSNWRHSQETDTTTLCLIGRRTIRHHWKSHSNNSDLHDLEKPKLSFDDSVANHLRSLYGHLTSRCFKK